MSAEDGVNLRQKIQMMPAAFFDLDGTLLPEPTLERRLMRFLYWRREWSPWNFARWLARYLRVSASPRKMPRDERWVLATHGNKRHWKNVRAASVGSFAERRPRIEFFSEGIRQMQWHASRGHRIFLVSGTLEELAQIAANELSEEMRREALPDAIGVCATRLEEKAGRWTGEASGEANWGTAKARAIERLGREHRIDLGRSFAYANSASDCGMLAKVGNPVAVNPSGKLRRIAEAAGWQIVSWKEQKRSRKREARAPELPRTASGESQVSFHGRREWE